MGMQALPISFVVSLEVTFRLQGQGQEFQVQGSTSRKASYYWYVYYVSEFGMTDYGMDDGFSSWWRQVF
jgi:hypothetical protein